MTVDYDSIQAAVKALGTVADNDAFLEGFLSAFNFPQATYGRLKAGMKSDIHRGLRIQGNGGVYFLASSAASLSSEFSNINKSLRLDRIKEGFIILVNETDILAYEKASENVLESSKKDLYRYIEFFFSFFGIKPEDASDEMKSADRKAAEKFAELYNELHLRNHNNSSDISEMLCRLLFCCFADSIGVLTNDGLRPLLKNYTDLSGSDTGAFFCNLFKAIKFEKRDNLPGYFSNVSYVDARLFSDEIPLLDFSKKARSLIIDLMALNWSDISPDILGSLIQSIVREEEGNSNNNYTDTSNVQKVIKPLFMDELYREFDRVKTSRKKSEDLLQRVNTISVFDPASGAGNFLLIAYKELCRLARKINNTIEELNTPIIFDRPSQLLQVSGKTPLYERSNSKQLVQWYNFYGIDDDAFSCSIARLGFLFVICQEAQGNADIKQVFKSAIEVLFSENIVVGNATSIDWRSICRNDGETYIVGNPSYTGARKQSGTQKADLIRVFESYTGISNLDHAACWFMLATKYINAYGGGFAFVTTKSLTQGEQVSLLWPKLFEYGVHIRFAYTPFKWKNDARNQTAVMVVVIGIVEDTDTQPCELFRGTTVLKPKSISPYLVPGNAIVCGRGTPISDLPRMFKGNLSYDGGNLLLNGAEVMAITSSDERARKFIKKNIGSKELIRGIDRWCIWIQDSDYEEAMSIPAIKERVDKVRDLRINNSDVAARRLAERPHQFREMRETHTLSLVVPAVSSENYVYIPIGFIDNETVVSNLVSVIYDCEEWIFGVVSSQMHNVWIRTVCGKHEGRPRYSLEIGYNTFPFPDITPEQKTIIRNCVRGVIRARERYVPNTLAQLYRKDRIPSDLLEAHALLDKVIESCYQQQPFVSDQERLECLFELYNKLGG